METTSISPSILQESRTNILAMAAILFALGLGLVFVSGFANADILHNGAHDSRHSLVFPCH